MSLDSSSVLVLGGSFNPPTIAHITLLRHALRYTGTHIGVLVPSSHNYVTRKCNKIGEDLIFSEETRKDMLLELARPYPEICVETGEYGDDGRGRSYNTMTRIQSHYPDRKCAFIVGSDVLPILPKWNSNDEFFKNFYFVVIDRNREDTEKIIQSNSKLMWFRDKLIVVPQLPEKFRNISSTQVRNLLKQPYSEETEKALKITLTAKSLQIARNAMKSWEDKRSVT